MTAVPGQQELVRRRLTQPGEDGYEGVEWTTRDVKMGTFEQKGVEGPASWSDRAVGIAAKLYFATIDGEKELGVKDVIDRVVDKIAHEGLRHNYFGVPTIGPAQRPSGIGQAVATFEAELTAILVGQYAAFNTPVWLNVGVPGRPQGCSACYLLSVEDTMFKGDHSITQWWDTEARVFKQGAGSGINVSEIRASTEPLSIGGVASGPSAYMRAADVNAGTLRSGGVHRRAAKLVCEDVDHPDIRDFIALKVRADEYMRALMAAGINLDPSTPSGERNVAETIPFQNTNHSVRVTDEFMERVTGEELPGSWELRARVSGEVVETVPAAELLREMAEAAWRCADPGVLFHDTINAMHTTPSAGPITTCNPCGETHQSDNTACNLASINLLKFLHWDEEQGCEVFDVDLFRHVVDVMVLAMDVTCSFSDLPTEELERNTREMRHLGLGFSNLGAALMAQGLPYDSDEGRDFAGSVTALLTGRAYRRSAELAERLGPYARYEENDEAHMRVIERHVDALPDHDDTVDDSIWTAAKTDWGVAENVGSVVGLRNAQASVIAPTGTISFLMDCDTTGIEPFFGLKTSKALAGGGTMDYAASVLPRAAASLGGYGAGRVLAFIDGDFSACAPEDRAVFATAGEISVNGHLLMMAAVQPFVSGGISKTVNLPNEATVDDVEQTFVRAWRLGLKCVSLYRDGSKATQVLTSGAKKVASPTGATVEALPAKPLRRRLPDERESLTHKFSIAGSEGYVHAGKHPDGTLGEVFLSGLGKQGSAVQGWADSFAIVVSIALQYGCPLEDLARKFAHVRFEPEGMTGNQEIPFAKSPPDYVMRWLASRFLPAETHADLGILDRQAPIVPASNGRLTGGLRGPVEGFCSECGGTMQRTGTCLTCTSCGHNTGCG